MRHADVRSARRPWGLLIVITAALLAGVAALVLSVVNQLGLQDKREADELRRVAADVASCERGNILRRDVIAVGEAGEILIVDSVAAVLDELGAPQERLQRALRALEPALENHAELIADIELVNCPAVTPGADNEGNDP